MLLNLITVQYWYCNMGMWNGGIEVHGTMGKWQLRISCWTPDEFRPIPNKNKINGLFGQFQQFGSVGKVRKLMMQEEE